MTIADIPDPTPCAKSGQQVDDVSVAGISDSASCGMVSEQEETEEMGDADSFGVPEAMVAPTSCVQLNISSSGVSSSNVSCLFSTAEFCSEADVKEPTNEIESHNTDAADDSQPETSVALKGDAQCAPVTEDVAKLKLDSPNSPCSKSNTDSGLKGNTRWNPTTGEPVRTPCGKDVATSSSKSDPKTSLKPIVPNAPYKDPKAGTFDVPALKPVKKPTPSGGRTVDCGEMKVDSSHFDPWTGEHIGPWAVEE
ncbi:hypothetical protein MMC13_001536 [Lambiella insularis]|nr:hypothetical protein [Lambiella insularis]